MHKSHGHGSGIWCPQYSIGATGIDWLRQTVGHPDGKPHRDGGGLATFPRIATRITGAPLLLQVFNAAGCFASKEELGAIRLVGSTYDEAYNWCQCVAGG